MPEPLRHADPALSAPSEDERLQSVAERKRRAQVVAIIVAVAFALFGLIRLHGAAVAEQLAHADAPVRIDLNRDPEAAIELLPRVGPSLAKRIVSEREERGPFSNLSDLVRRVPGLGSRTAELLERHIAFGATAKP
jgi:DNA uptake protein ComE-like DNA-binding protein